MQQTWASAYQFISTQMIQAAETGELLREKDGKSLKSFSQACTKEVHH